MRPFARPLRPNGDETRPVRLLEKRRWRLERDTRFKLLKVPDCPTRMRPSHSPSGARGATPRLLAAESLARDVRFAVRALRRDAAVAAFAVLIAGLGIG